MTLKSDDVSKRFDSLFGGKLVGTRHAEDGRLYAIVKDDGRTHARRPLTSSRSRTCGWARIASSGAA